MGADRRVWQLDKTGMYTCKSMFQKLISIPQDHQVSSFSFIWKSCCSMKVKVNTWLISLDKANTQDVLQKHMPFFSISPRWCIMCSQSEDLEINYFYIVPLHIQFGLDF